MDKLKNYDFESVGDFAKIDHHRFLRTGFPEVIYASGKTTEQIRDIFEAMRGQADSGAVIMATRVSPEVFTVRKLMQLNALLKQHVYAGVEQNCRRARVPCHATNCSSRVA
jgi:NCAIR mutase (PurE)-related protein